MKHQKNIVILTAVQREYDEIHKCLSGECEEKIFDGHRYEIFSKIIEGKSCRIIISMTGQGNSEAATRASHAISKFKPILIIFTGTCGAIKDASIGDIVIAQRVYDFTRGKETDRSESVKPVSKEINPIVRSISESLSLKVNRGELLKDFFQNKRKVYIGSIASSSVIVAGNKTKTKQKIKKYFADAIAVELEGYGFYTATYENDIYGIIIRGVTDDTSYKDNVTDEIIQPKVMNATSRFVFEFIEHFIDIKHPKRTNKCSKIDSNNFIGITNFFQNNNDHNTIKSLIKSNKNFFCSFLSFNTKSIEQKAHLGHCYFINLIDKILINNKTILFLCTTNQTPRDMSLEDYNAIANHTTKIWKKCFLNNLEVVDVRKHLKSNQIRDYDLEKKYNSYFSEIREKIFKTNDEDIEKLQGALKDWRILEKDLDYNHYICIQEYLSVNHADIEFMNINKHEVISMAYIMICKPKWFSEEWFIDFTIFWKYKVYDIIRNNKKDVPNKLTILESKRNSYVWYSFSFASKKIIRIPIFENKLFFNNVPNINLKGYMKTSDEKTAIFLKDFDYEKINKTNPNFIETISNMFLVDKEDVESLLLEYKKRLSIMTNNISEKLNNEVKEMKSNKKRFRIALSFPGEYRDAIIHKIALSLAEVYSKDEILYDEFHSAEFARPNLDTYLQNLYHDESELIVVFLCEDYANKPWCGIEYRVIRTLIHNKKEYRIMPVKIGTGHVDGFFNTLDGYIIATENNIMDTVSQIISRYQIIKLKENCL